MVKKGSLTGGIISCLVAIYINKEKDTISFIDGLEI